MASCMMKGFYIRLRAVRLGPGSPRLPDICFSLYMQITSLETSYDTENIRQFGRVLCEHQQYDATAVHKMRRTRNTKTGLH